jgi:gamma-glutamyltranspeptidase/glutathione hydrolase
MDGMRMCNVIQVTALLSLLLVVSSFAVGFRAVRSADGPSFARYAVAADHPEASAAGAAVLAAGGNAADAAAATMLALGVVSPASSGLGGGGFALYYRARDKTLSFLDFRETAPGKASPEMFRERPGEAPEVAKERSQRGGLAVAVPGEPLGIAELVKRFGTKPLSFSVKPAERLAREGFTLSEHTRRMLAYAGPELAKQPAILSVFGALTGDAGTAPARAKNPALAATLRKFAQSGPKIFYTGPLARQIVQAARRAGGMLELSDLARYRVVDRTPLRLPLLGFDWVSAPPPSAGGYTILTSLALLGRALPPAERTSGLERMHALIESWKGPYLDRQRYFGDPDHVHVPLSALLEPARSDERARRFKREKARPTQDYDLPLPPETPPAKPADDHGTSHLCVVDEEGNVAAVTTTVNLIFGAQIPVAGLWLNNEMDDFAREVGKENAFGLVGGAPNLPGPNKRPVSSMAPTIVFSGDAPVLCVGASGGSRIPTAIEQVALYVLKDGLHPAAAAAAPRVHHQGEPDQVGTRDVSEAMIKALAARGHKLAPAGFSAHVQAIRIAAGDAGVGRLLAGSDPGKGGEPKGE